MNWRKRCENQICGITVLRNIIVSMPVILFAQEEIKPEDLLKMSLEELMNVKVVTAAKHIQEIWESPSTISVITADELKYYGYSNLWEALKRIVGSIPADNGDNVFIGFRGLLEPSTFNSRILWLVDSHTLNESYFQRSFPGYKFPVDLDNVEKIEVISGPGSVLYGSNAFLGIVNVITKNGSDVDGLLFSSEVSGYMNPPGGYDIEGDQNLVSIVKSQISYGKKFVNDKELYVSLSYLNDSGQTMYIPYFTATKTGGYADKIDFIKAYQVYAKYKHRDLTIFGGYHDSKSGHPLADYWADPNSKDNKSLTNIYFFETNYKHKWKSNINSMIRAYIDRHDFIGTWIYDGSPNLDRQHVPSNWMGSEIQISKITNDNYLLSGVEYRYYTTSPSEDYPSENNYFHEHEYNFYDIAAYLQDDIKFADKLRFNIGGRYEYNRYYKGIFIGRTSLTFKLRPTTVFKLQYGDAFKNPLLHDFFYHSSILQLHNNKIVELKRERVKTLEFIWSQHYKYLNSNIVLFFNQFDNYVRITPDDYYINGKGITSTGIEAEFRYRLQQKLDCYFNLGYHKTTDKETDKAVLNTPAYCLKFGSIYNVLPTGKLSIAVEGQHYGSADYMDHKSRPEVDLKQTTYTVINTNILCQDCCLGMDLSFGVNNLFNTAYEYAVTKGTAQSFPANGRNFHIKISRKL